MYYVVVYFKNYDEIINDNTYGNVESYAYRAYPNNTMQY